MPIFPIRNSPNGVSELQAHLETVRDAAGNLKDGAGKVRILKDGIYLGDVKRLDFVGTRVLASLTGTVVTVNVVARAAATAVVTTTAGLINAVNAASPGDIIEINATGNLARWSQSNPPAGTAGNNITIRAAVGMSPVFLADDPTGTTRGMNLEGFKFYRFEDLSTYNGEFGMWAKGIEDCVFLRCTWEHTGKAAVVCRQFSKRNLFDDCTFTDTGHKDARQGEGLYFGSDGSSWDSFTGGLPDASDDNVVRNSTFTSITADSIDIKDGTNRCVAEYNTIDDSSNTHNDEFIVAIGCKGKDATVRYNTITGVRTSGIHKYNSSRGHQYSTGFAAIGNTITAHSGGATRYGVEIRANSAGDDGYLTDDHVFSGTFALGNYTGTLVEA